MFELNDRFKDISPYVPNEKNFDIYLDANESFLDLPDIMKSEIEKAFASVKLNRYPDPVAMDTVEAFSRYYGVPAENVVAGNGSDELISLLFSAFMDKGDTFATISPDFSMYEIYGKNFDMDYLSIPKNSDFTIDTDRVIEQCNSKKVRMLIFSNPCNPTSLGIKREAVLKVVKSTNALVVVDEAYMDFWNQSIIDSFNDFDNMIILRTASKAFGLAGIRLGFAVSNSRIINAMKMVKSPYNVNSITQLIGKISLSHKNLTEKAIKAIIDSKNALYTELLKLSESTKEFEVLESDTNFVVIRLNEAVKLYEYLIENRIAVRYTSGIIRVTAGTGSENEKFLSVCKEFFNKER